jgi:hypothetical protein
MSYLSYNTGYRRSDGTYLGDSHGEMPNGVNPYEIREDGLAERVITRRNNQILAVLNLQQQMSILFNRVHLPTTPELYYIKDVYNTTECFALSGVRRIERELEHQGYLADGMLENLYATMSAQSTYMYNARCKLKREGINIQQFFNYLQLLDECLRLCVITIEAYQVYDPYFTAHNTVDISQNEHENVNPRFNSDDEA